MQFVLYGIGLSERREMRNGEERYRLQVQVEWMEESRASTSTIEQVTLGSYGFVPEPAQR